MEHLPLATKPSSSGQSLVQVLVAVAVMSIVGLTMATMFTNLSREFLSVTEKVSALDLEKAMIATMADGSVCQYLLNNPALTFDSTSPMSTTNPVAINLPSSPAAPATIYASVVAGPPVILGPPVAQVGQRASPYSTSLVVSNISLQLTGVSGTSFVGYWRVSFDNTKTVRPIKSVSVSTSLTADISVPTAAKVTSCQGSSSGGGTGNSGSWCGAFQVDNMGNVTIPVPCNGLRPSCGYGPGGSCSRLPLSSFCPSGYTPTPVMTAMTSLLGTSPGGNTCLGYSCGTPPSSTLYTCTH